MSVGLCDELAISKSLIFSGHIVVEMTNIHTCALDTVSVNDSVAARVQYNQ
jgi:hypothetical protein